jgi:lipopolysaccharide transport system ATP-binding protein
MSNIAIRAEKLSKKYRLGAAKVRHDTLRDHLVGGIKSLLKKEPRPSQDESIFWALKAVSLEIKQGEVVGIIGRNGAGKSTLLKLLARITDPTSGVAEIHGRVGSLLEVGTGFSGELTGRENTYLNGAILGMTKKEIDRKFDEIVAFAEVERFVDTPVKHYSSGMYLRLAFAVAAHLEPEILLVDEVLAVGDIAFQRKCLGKMGDVARQGRTILFVSHNMAAVESLCSTAYLLENGQLVESGTTKTVVDAYLSSIPALCNTSLEHRTDREGDGRLRFTDIEFRSDEGVPTAVVQTGKTLLISVAYTSTSDTVKNVEMSIDIFAQSGQCMLILNNEIVGADFESVPGVGRFSCRVERFPLSPGQYPITLFCMANGIIADWVQQAALLTVEPGDFYGTGRLPPATHGGFLIPQEWQIQSNLVSNHCHSSGVALHCHENANWPPSGAHK